MSKLYYLYCTDESKMVTVWSSVTPTTCPNNPVHQIEIDSVSSNNGVFGVTENTYGYFETTHIAMNIPTVTPGTIVTYDVTWPMDITLWKTLITPTPDMLGDVISVLAAPETTVGVITSLVSIGDTTINVNSTVTTNTERGFLITIDDGVNKNVCGRCTNVNAGVGTITFQTPTINSYSIGTPVKISIYVLKDIRLIDTNTIDIGNKGFKGKNIPSGMILRVYYTNNSGTSKTIYWRPEYYANG